MRTLLAVVVVVVFSNDIKVGQHTHMKMVMRLNDKQILGIYLWTKELLLPLVVVAVIEDVPLVLLFLY